MEWPIVLLFAAVAMLFAIISIMGFLLYEQNKIVHEVRAREINISAEMKTQAEKFYSLKADYEEEIDEIHNVAEMQGDVVNGIDERLLELDKSLTGLCAGSRLIMPLAVGMDAGDSREEYYEDEDEEE